MGRESHTLPQEFYMNFKFADVDAFSKAVQGWDLDFRQLERGAFSSRLGLLITPRCSAKVKMFSSTRRRLCSAPDYSENGRRLTIGLLSVPFLSLKS